MQKTNSSAESMLHIAEATEQPYNLALMVAHQMSGARKLHHVGCIPLRRVICEEKLFVERTPSMKSFPLPLTQLGVGVLFKRHEKLQTKKENLFLPNNNNKIDGHIVELL